jgi:hypothetical protein
LRAFTESSLNFYTLPIDLIICGAEKIIADKNLSFDFKFLISSNPIKYKWDMVKEYLHSSNPKCEIIEYTITEDDDFGKTYFELYPII